MHRRSSWYKAVLAFVHDWFTHWFPHHQAAAFSTYDEFMSLYPSASRLRQDRFAHIQLGTNRGGLWPRKTAWFHIASGEHMPGYSGDDQSYLVNWTPTLPWDLLDDITDDDCPWDDDDLSDLDCEMAQHVPNTGPRPSALDPYGIRGSIDIDDLPDDYEGPCSLFKGFSYQRSHGNPLATFPSRKEAMSAANISTNPHLGGFSIISVVPTDLSDVTHQRGIDWAL